uniref:RIC3 domain-containing protein n=1 Tax=Macrostomum lignano TaxID=282301 RepID=A0A1I8FKT5_9PLAT
MKMIGSERAWERICRVWPSSATCVLGTWLLASVDCDSSIRESGGLSRACFSSKQQQKATAEASATAHIMTRSGVMDAGFVLKPRQNLQDPLRGHGVDFIDQLNYQFTGGLMTIFIVIIGLRQYFGEPGAAEGTKAGNSKDNRAHSAALAHCQAKRQSREWGEQVEEKNQFAKLVLKFCGSARG